MTLQQIDTLIDKSFASRAGHTRMRLMAPSHSPESLTPLLR
jgi:hypothetical protein